MEEEVLPGGWEKEGFRRENFELKYKEKNFLAEKNGFLKNNFIFKG